MKIILFFVFTSLVTTQFNIDQYKHQFEIFCSGVNKNVCTKETLKLGIKFYQSRLKEINEDNLRKQQLLREAKKNRRIQQMKEERLLQIIRERFLDRHIRNSL
jgi:hypothetical protein